MTNGLEAVKELDAAKSQHHESSHEQSRSFIDVGETIKENTGQLKRAKCIMCSIVMLT